MLKINMMVPVWNSFGFHVQWWSTPVAPGHQFPGTSIGTFVPCPEAQRNFWTQNYNKSNLEEFCKKNQVIVYIKLIFSFFFEVIFGYLPKISSQKIGLNARVSKIPQGRVGFRWISIWVGEIWILASCRPGGSMQKSSVRNIHAALRSMTLEVNDHLNNGGFFWMIIFAPTKIMVVRKSSTKKKGGWTSRDYIAISHQSHEDRCFFSYVSSFFIIFHIFHMLSTWFRCLFQGASSLAISYSLCKASCGWSPRSELPTSTGEWLPDVLKHQQDILMYIVTWWILVAKLQGFSYFFNGLVQPPTSWLLFFPGFFPVIFFAVHWCYPPGN